MVEEVERRLAARPEAACESGGPKDWPPLLYLCFGRAPLAPASDNAVAFARALLDRGADPNSYYDAPCPYSALVGVAGEGEEDAPPHPQAEALARLLLERGAEPYDIQLLYNTHFHDDVRWLELVYTLAVRLGRQSDWDDPHWSMLNFGGYGAGARFLLHGAVTRNHLQRAVWLLEHGASPNAPLPPHTKLPQRTLHEEALCRGFTEMADLLLRFGATPGAPPAQDPFQTACLRLDRAAAQALIEQHPEYLRVPGPMTAAAEQDRVEVVAFLLDLGMSPDIEDPEQGRQSPLHVAAYSDAPRVASLLIERGAAVDPRESIWGGTPLSFAIYAQKPRMIELLSSVSRELFPLASLGKVERLRELLRDEPELARVVKAGRTPLMGLPDDQARALDIVELFLAHGADPTLRNNEGLIAADCARQRGLEEVANRLRR
jgi:ankyrin repeat protein